MSYRLELAKTQRSGCCNVECKNNGEKIPKNTLRHGTMVTIQEHQTWKWRHWGCVTPVQIGNMSSAIEGNFDYLDGYDELPADLQEKVRNALSQGHVDDEDWKGDPEKNRPGQRGFRVTSAKKKKAAEDVQAENRDGSPTPNQKAPKKRGRAKKEDGEDPGAGDAQEPPKKKSKAPTKRARNAKDEDSKVADAEVPVAKKAKATAKKDKKSKDDHNSEAANTEAPPLKKVKAPTKKETEVLEKEAGDALGTDEAPPPKKARGRKSKVAEEEATEPAEELPKMKRGRKKTGGNGPAIAPQDAEATTAIEPKPSETVKKGSRSKKS